MHEKGGAGHEFKKQHDVIYERPTNDFIIHSILGAGPPVLPMKERFNGTDNQSLSNFDTQSNMSGSRDDIASIRKKKAPPPPPPIINYNGAMTPPTPPRKAPLNAP